MKRITDTFARWLSKVLWGDDSDDVMNFVPAQTNNTPDWLALVATARERHGKPFLAHTLKPRETEPTRDLVELNNASNPQPVIVLADERRKAK